MNPGDLVSGKYRLQRLLGAGSMGSVWAARNELTNRDFAIKFLRPDLSRDEEALHRFFLEARACGQIRHPAIVDVYDMGQADDGSPYLVMELLEGEGFDQRLSRQTKLRAVDICRYVALVARGLDEAHKRGLIHRDLKPGNIFFAIDKGGDVLPKVLDFGISKEMTSGEFVSTNTGAVLGSPAYMSPEQASGELDVDARSDIWSLGVIMYEALTGELPFDAGNYNALMVKIINEPYVSAKELASDVPPALSDVVDGCLEKDRSKRIGSTGELADQLERVYHTLTDTPLAHPERPLSVPPPGGTTDHSWYTVTPEGKRKLSPAVWIGGTLALAGLIAGGVAISMASSPSVPRVSRVSAAVRAAVAQAESRLTAEQARQRTEAAEAAAREAEEQAEEKDENDSESDAEPAVRRVRPGARRSTPRNGHDVHGGVSGPGF